MPKARDTPRGPASAADNAADTMANATASPADAVEAQADNAAQTVADVGLPLLTRVFITTSGNKWHLLNKFFPPLVKI